MCVPGMVSVGKKVAVPQLSEQGSRVGVGEIVHALRSSWRWLVGRSPLK